MIKASISVGNYFIRLGLDNIGFKILDTGDLILYHLKKEPTFLVETQASLNIYPQSKKRPKIVWQLRVRIG